MTPARLSLLAAIGVACIASSVFLAKTTPPKAPSLLDRVYES